MSFEQLKLKNLKFYLNIDTHPKISLVLLLVFSLFIKSYLIYQAQIINPDGIRYINSANEMFQGNIAAAFYHEKMLGYTFLLGLVHLIFTDWFVAGKVLSCVALVLTTLPLYLITRELFGQRAAFFAALIFTVVPNVNERSVTVIKDPAFLFLVVLALWLVIYALRESRWGVSLAAGLLCCLSVLVRPDGIVFFSAVTFFLMFSIVFFPKCRYASLQHLASFCFFPLAALLLAIFPFAAGLVSDEVLPNISIRFAYYFQTDLTQIYMSIYQHLKDVEDNFPGGNIPNDFFEFARHNIYLIYLIGLMQTFLKSMFPVFVVPLAFGLNLQNRWNRLVALLLTVLGVFLLMDYLFLMSRNFLSARYLFVPVTLSFIFAGYGMDRMIAYIQTCRFRKTFIFFALMLCVVFPAARSFTSVSHEKLEIKNAGIWLRDYRNVAPDRMIVNDERIAFYAGLMRSDYHPFRDEKIDRLEKTAQQLNMEVIAVYLRKTDVANLTDFKEFKLVKSFEGEEHVAMIYERRNDG